MSNYRIYDRGVQTMVRKVLDMVERNRTRSSVV